jgi:hypothetical protein
LYSARSFRKRSTNLDIYPGCLETWMTIFRIRTSSGIS